MRDKSTRRKELEAHELVVRLLNNPNWKPAAVAAINYLIDGKECPVRSWKKSSTWAQVEVAYEELFQKN